MEGFGPPARGIVCAGRKVVEQSGNWETEIDRLPESGAIAGSKELWTCRADAPPPARTAPPRPDGRASLSPDPASPAARDPRGCSSPFPRRASLRRRLRPRDNAATLLRGARACLALLGAAALLALAAPAQAQTEVWTATLTPGDLGLSMLGCSNGVDAARCSSTTVLSEDSFNYDSTDYTITALFVRSGGRFELTVDADITTNTAALTLVVGSTSLVLNAGTASGARTRIWDSSGVSLTAGTDIAVKLTAPVTNTAPTAANNTVATAQGTAYSFTAGDFGFDDADTGDTLASVKIVTLPTPGTLALDGTAVVADAVVTKADIDDDKLTFTPVAGASGDPYTTFTFKVNDGTDDSASAYTMTIDVTAAANNAPTSADEHLEADEDMDYTFSSADFAFADTDTGDSLASVKIVTLPASGTGTLTLSGTTIGSGALPKTVPADEIDDLKYSPPANLHGTDVASFTFKVNDGTDDSDSAYTMTIDVTAANDPATGEPTISGTARVGRTLAVSTAGIMDVDGLPSRFSYQWLRKAGAASTSISGANSRTYTLRAADLGNKVAVRVSFTDDDDGSSEMRTSGDYPTSGTVQANNILVSNTGQTTTNSFRLGLSDLAQPFTTGANPAGYTLSSIELKLDSSDRTSTPTVKLYRGSANGTSVATFTGPAMLDTNTTKTYTFTPSSTVTVLRSTTYWVVAEGVVRWVTGGTRRGRNLRHGLEHRQPVVSREILLQKPFRSASTVPLAASPSRTTRR